MRTISSDTHHRKFHFKVRERDQCVPLRSEKISQATILVKRQGTVASIGESGYSVEVWFFSIPTLSLDAGGVTSFY